MRVWLQPSTDAAVSVVADMVEHGLRQKPDLVLGLATGRTMEAVYADLVRRHQSDGLDFSRCRTFNLDEYVGLSPSDPQSYHQYMRRHLFSHVNLPPGATHLPQGDADNPAAACRQYEQAIRDCGGIDIQLLGIGMSGHIGFNEPLSAFGSRTRVVRLAPATLSQNQALFGPDRKMPRQGMTMGVATILEARRCVLLATGSEKAGILADALEGPVTARVTATALHWHPDAWVIADPAAASGLKHADEYHALLDASKEDI